MIIRVEKLRDESYRKRIPYAINSYCNNRIRILNAKIKRSQVEADSIWDSFIDSGLHKSVIELMYQGKKGVLDKYIEEKKHVEDIKSGNIMYFSLDSEIKDVDWDYVLLYIENILKQGKKVFFSVDGDIDSKHNDSSINYTYTKEELDNIGRVDALLKSYNQEGVYFDEESRVTSYKNYSKVFTYDDVRYCNDRIEEIVSIIKENDFSPFETMLYIHEYVTNNFEYYDDNKGTQNPRVLPGIFKGEGIVCSGYASIVKAIIDRLDDPRLKCMIVGCTIRKPESSKELMYQYRNHTHNLIYINDEKYHLKGYYVEDASWDSRVEGREEGYGISNCMYPIEDLFHHECIEYYHRFYDSRKKNILESVVHPYFRKPSRYKNKEKVAQIVRLYKSKSTPIGVDVYRSGLSVLAPVLGLDVDKEIEKSVEVANILCDEEAISCFSRCRNR